MSENNGDNSLLPVSSASERYAVEDEGDWLADGREEIRRLLENEPVYHNVLREESPFLYWSWEFTPDPPDEIARELNG